MRHFVECSAFSLALSGCRDGIGILPQPEAITELRQWRAWNRIEARHSARSVLACGPGDCGGHTLTRDGSGVGSSGVSLAIQGTVPAISWLERCNLAYATHREDVCTSWNDLCSADFQALMATLLLHFRLLEASKRGAGKPWWRRSRSLPDGGATGRASPRPPTARVASEEVGLRQPRAGRGRRSEP